MKMQKWVGRIYRPRPLVFLAAFLVITSAVGVAQYQTSPYPKPDSTGRQYIQFAYGKLMAGESTVWLGSNGTERMGSVEGLTLPYTAPPGYRIGIVGMYIGSKMNDRASYIGIDSVFALPDRSPSIVFAQPIWLRPNTTLQAYMINNSPTQQWMVGLIQVVIEPER